jgi:uncharacterized protein DUF1697
MRYIAFLRAINVGGNNIVKMDPQAVRRGTLKLDNDGREMADKTFG